LTSLDLLNGTALLGYSSGTVRLLDLTKGLVGRPGTSQGEESGSEGRGHTTRVVSVAASPYLQHFVTCSVDGMVKVGCYAVVFHQAPPALHGVLLAALCIQ
jgi:hypothetical protein